mmetsp:Transcript_6917/g.22216  ORF Transcript_6917/g.22216 Transcript_6917/m.22216 type:complete len:316 (-) Transcript_6917:69-1016(-)
MGGSRKRKAAATSDSSDQGGVESKAGDSGPASPSLPPPPTHRSSMHDEFEQIKEKYFKERFSELKAEVESIVAGTHPDFLAEGAAVKEEVASKVARSRAWLEAQIDACRKQYESEVVQHESEGRDELRKLRDRLVNAVLERKKELIEEKNVMTLGGGGSSSAGTRANTRTLRRRGAHGSDAVAPGLPAPLVASSARRRVNPPHINYALRETEVYEDVEAIRHQLGQSSTLSAAQRAAAAASHPVDVVVDRSSITINGKKFERTELVTVTNRADQRWTGHLLSINSAELQLRSSLGERSRFAIAQFRSGKLALTPA